MQNKYETPFPSFLTFSFISSALLNFSSMVAPSFSSRLASSWNIIYCYLVNITFSHLCIRYTLLYVFTVGWNFLDLVRQKNMDSPCSTTRAFFFLSPQHLRPTRRFCFGRRTDPRLTGTVPCSPTEQNDGNCFFSTLLF